MGSPPPPAPMPWASRVPPPVDHRRGASPRTRSEGWVTSVTFVHRHDDLITLADASRAPHEVAGRMQATVGAALETPDGARYTGVCLDLPSGLGACAEYAAVAAMVADRHHRVTRIVAVRADADGALRVLPPCGRCRELLRQVDPQNLDTEVVLSRDRSRPLRDLLPLHDWPDPLPM